MAEARLGRLAAVLCPAAAGALFKSPYKFSKHGASGMDFSELQPHLSRHADDISLIR